MQIYADTDPEPGQTLKSQKVEFFHKYTGTLKVVKGAKTWQEIRFVC
jgi:hypothetical protein